MSKVTAAQVSRVRDAFNLSMTDARNVTLMYGSADAVFEAHDPQQGIYPTTLAKAAHFRATSVTLNVVGERIQGLVDAFNVDYARACATSDVHAYYDAALIGRQIVHALAKLKVIDDTSYEAAVKTHEG
jgi:hypothetical protein